MSIKYVNCKKCDTPNLVWVFSAKGKWYLSDPAAVSTTYGGNKVIPFAHRCRIPQVGDCDYHADKAAEAIK